MIERSNDTSTIESQCNLEQDTATHSKVNTNFPPEDICPPSTEACVTHHAEFLSKDSVP